MLISYCGIRLCLSPKICQKTLKQFQRGNETRKFALYILVSFIFYEWCFVLDEHRLQDVELITEDATAISGSCCDDGKFVFKECGNFWYNCQMSGLVDIKTWIRFGKNGLTMSLTEHKGRCVYSSERQLCAIPTECSIENSINPASISEICREVPSIWSSDPAVPSQVFDRRHQAPFNGGIFKDDEASVNSNVFGKNKKGFIGGKILHIPDNLR